MKKAILAILLFSFLLSCNSKSTTPKTIRSDTSRIAGLWVDFETKSVKYGLMWMIVRDTFVFKPSKDTSVLKREWVVDTAYFTPRLIKDSLGKEVLIGVPASFETVSIERNADTAQNKLYRWIVEHPQYFNQPKK